MASIFARIYKALLHFGACVLHILVKLQTGMTFFPFTHSLIHLDLPTRQPGFFKDDTRDNEDPMSTVRNDECALTSRLLPDLSL